MQIRALFLAALVLGSTATHGTASPITYDFSGTLAQPINGSNAFSGTFSYEQTISGFSTGDFVSRSVGGHATLNVGGQSYAFTNYTYTPLVPSPPYTFDANSKGQGDNFTFLGAYGMNKSSSDPNAPGAAMAIHLGDPSGTAFPSFSPSLPTLNLASFWIRDFSVTILPGGTSGAGTMSAAATSVSGTPVAGTITSLSPEVQTVPEPTTLALFATIVLGLAARRRFRQTV